MPLPPLPDDAIWLSRTAADWREAVQLAGDALAASGAATADYAGDMIRMIDEHGPYVVIAPGLALVHTRPSADVLTGGMSVVTLAEPVAFGHPHHDPVSVIVGLASTTAESHLAAVAQLANRFNDARAIERLARAGTVSDVRAVIA